MRCNASCSAQERSLGMPWLNETSADAPVAVVRVEQLYPLPTEQMFGVLEFYPNAREVVWLQEEPENMGAWKFIEHRFWRVKERGYDFRHVARHESGSPATGSKTVHDQELADLMDALFIRSPIDSLSDTNTARSATSVSLCAKGRRR